MSDVPFYKRLYRKRSVRIAAVVVAIPGLALAWWLGSPLFLDTEIDEAFPGAVVPADMTADEVEKEMADAASSDVETDEEMPAPGDLAVLASGPLMGVDSVHQGSGTVSVYQLEDGSRVLRLEDIDVTNGPDLHVFLTPAASVEGSEDVMAPGYLDLGSLKGNIGSQNYDLPPDYDLPDQFTIVIYCVPFNVVFATAELS
jgi:hypothetical protein